MYVYIQHTFLFLFTFDFNYDYYFLLNRKHIYTMYNVSSLSNSAGNPLKACVAYT